MWEFYTRIWVNILTKFLLLNTKNIQWCMSVSVLEMLDKDVDVLSLLSDEVLWHLRGYVMEQILQYWSWRATFGL